MAAGMGEVVNLRGARKQRARTEAEQAARENRARFGRTRAEKVRDAAEAARKAKAADQARLDR